MTNVPPSPRRVRRERPTPATVDAPLGSVTITAREVYDAVMELAANVKTALDRGEKTAEKVEDHEGRIRNLEANRWPLPALGALVAIAALLVAIFKS